MKDEVVNCARSWSVAWTCSFINFLLLGVSRLSGLLYLASISRYGVDRSRASLPFVLCYTVRNVAGPLIGYLGRRVEIRLLIASGCCLSALGAGACFFAEDITTVTVLWGGIYGLGFGLGTILLPEVLNQHFDKYISNANGIAFGGECVAGFVLPVIVELLLDTYGTSGTFLILSGLILHGVPAALLLRPPKSCSNSSHNCDDISDSARKNNTSGKQPTSEYIRNEAFASENNSDTKAFSDAFISHRETLNEKCDHENYKGKCLKADLDAKEPSYSTWLSVSKPLLQGNPSSKDFKTLKYRSCNKQFGNSDCSSVAKSFQTSAVQCSLDYCNSNCHAIHRNNQTENANGSIQSPSDQGSLEHCSFNNHSIRGTNQTEIRNSSIQSPNPTTSDDFDRKKSPFHAFRVFLDPPFMLILLTQSSMIFIFTTFMTVVVDFSRDAGVAAHQEVYVLMCLSVSDMLGRFGLGWVTDLKFMNNVAFSAVCYAGTGLLMVALVYLRGFAMLMLVVFLIGLFLGGLLIVGPGIILDHIEKDKVTMALASRFVLYAPMSLTQSSLIGFFREKLGSYNGLFCILGINSFLCCAFSLFVPCASARLKSSRKKVIESGTSENDCVATTTSS